MTTQEQQLEFWEKAKADNPGDPLPHRFLGFCHAAANRRDDTLRSFTEWLRRKDNLDLAEKTACTNSLCHFREDNKELLSASPSGSPGRPINTLHVIYRLSDAGNKKPRLTDRFTSLHNFLRNFSPSATSITYILDKCGDETTQKLVEIDRAVYAGGSRARLIQCALGNSGTCRLSYNLACELPDEDGVYFVEDDYLHLEGSQKAMLEGLAIADYVTLYDNPDKYKNAPDGGNPLVDGGGELTRVFRTPSTHWKQTSSCTMTFAARVSAFKEDRPLFDKHTYSQQPDDFGIFLNLALRSQRALINPIPSLATHTEMAGLAPGIDWRTLIGPSE